MKPNVAVNVRGERVTILELEGRTLKLLQADQTAERLHLRHLEVREVPEGDVRAAAQTLREMAATLDHPVGRCVGIVPRSELVVRYAKLPSREPAELLRLATYQMHGELPFPVEQCIVTLQPLATDPDGTRVFLAAVHRPVVDRLVTLAQSAGLTLDGIAVSTEGVAWWATRLWSRLGVTPPRGWLFAAVAGETVELGIVVQGTLVFMRRTTMPELTPERLATILQETVAASVREPVEGRPDAALLIGAFPNPSVWEDRVEAAFGRPVSVVDPASSQLWDEPVATAAMELLHEVELVDLLGVATRPRQIALDLLPVEIKQERIRARERRVWGEVAGWAAAAVLIAGAVGAAGLGRSWWQVRQLETEIAQIESSAQAVQAQVKFVEQGIAARAQTGALLTLLAQTAAHMPGGVTWSSATLEAQGRLLMKGTAPDYETLFTTVSAVSGISGVRRAQVQSAIQRQAGQVEFEILVEGGR